jgi:hypothetical protein
MSSGGVVPRAYRCWLTPLALSAAVLTAMAVAGLVTLVGDRCGACSLELQPVGSDRTLVPAWPAVVVTVGVVAAVGGMLLLMSVRPVRPRILVRSAALQTSFAAVGPLLLLRSQFPARLLLVLLLAAASFLPALGLSGVAYLRLPRYRPIPRRPL